MAVETSQAQDHAVGVSIHTTRDHYRLEPDPRYFEMIAWCRADNVAGEFHARLLRFPSGNIAITRDGYHGVFTFSDPNAAFAFKMRWA